MRNKTTAIWLVSLLWSSLSIQVAAQSIPTAIATVQPRTCKPGEKTQLVIHGKGLEQSLRIISSNSRIKSKINKIEPSKITASLSLSDQVQFGPIDLWLTTKTGAVKRHTIIVDDLEAVRDNGNNHSVESAQLLTTRCSVEGTCDASVSDFYSIAAKAGERLAFEVHTQQLRSAMDPVIRLFNSAGESLLRADDTSVGPDSRFSFRFEEEGAYFLEIHDSKNSAGGMPYQLRIGDFPIVQQCYPLTAESGQKAVVNFLGPDGNALTPRELDIPSEADGIVFVQARFDGGESSSWVPLNCSSHPQVFEKEAEIVQSFPIGISGRLEQRQEVDVYKLKGLRGKKIRIAAKTRSLGSPTLLQMKLVNPSGAKVAETKVGDTDEWSFDATFAEDGIYKLEVNDLLNRGGDEFSYSIEIMPSGTFAVALKADAKTSEQLIVESKQGACAVDLQISRFGYDGEIELAITNPDSAIRIMNPRIPAKAKTARIYLTGDQNWNASSFAVVQMVASSVSDSSVRCLVDNHALHRIKEPFLLSQAGSSGEIVISATNETDAPFSIALPDSIPFARPVRSHTALLMLKRDQAEFKAGVEVLPHELPEGWESATKIEKESYTLTLKRGDQAVGEPDELSLAVYGEFKGHGRIETVALPVRWFDPVQASIEFSEPLVSGGRASGNVRLHREGDDAQAVILTLENLPAGVTAPAKITIAADQSNAVFDLQIGDKAALGLTTEFTLKASSKFTGQDFTVTSTHALPPIVAEPQTLAIFPSAVDLSDSRARQQLVVTGIANQQTRDWTRFARMTSSNPSVAKVQSGKVFPAGNGDCEIVIEVGGQQTRVPVRISGMESSRRIEFESEVLVALSKHGCNSGACHGAPSGKGGFRLSLRAFDQKLDQLTLIREDFGRRVNPLDPAKSLLILKPLMKVPHGGGKQIRKGDVAYEILRDWIAGGARADPEDAERVSRLEVFPNQKKVLSIDDGGQQLAVTAHFGDGRKRDVTHLVAYETSDTAVATVDAHGFVTPHDRGEVAILVRMLEHIESVPMMFVDHQEGFEWKSPPPNNYVDNLVNDKLKELQFLPSETCSDDEFLRRVSLDVLGILPTVDETTAFLADSSEDKRKRLVDELLQRDEYAKFWALKWGDLLKMTSKLVGDEGVYKYHRWVEQSLHDNVPYDEFAKQLITGTGSTLANPPANFYRTSTDMNECVETISQVFLGARLQCAKCHNHPFERWTQDNYYGLGAFFNRVQRRGTNRPGEMFVYTKFSGDVTQPRTGQVMAPWLPQTGSVDSPQNSDRRIAFADWLVNPGNPYFARIEANRIWSQLFSRGIVEPIDDFRASNPPSNARLLDALANDFVQSGFDRKHLLRVILNSRTYQASFRTTSFNEEDKKYFSHQEPRLLGAEQLLDAINSALALEQKLGTLPQGTLATQLPAPDIVKVDFLKVFGQPERSTVCACERADDSNLGMAIELFNGPFIHEKLRHANNRFRNSLAEGKPLKAVIREVYLAAVCRQPSEIELNAAVEHCDQNPDPLVGVEDVCWALFNTDEFLFQH